MDPVIRNCWRISDVLDPARPRVLVRRVDLPRVDAVFDDPQGEVIFALLAQDASQQIYVIGIELAIAGGRALGIDQTLALQESDLGDGHIRELFEQQRQNFPNRKVTCRRLSVDGRCGR